MELVIANRKIGVNFPVFIIAELSANHIQNFDIAVDTIRTIKQSGADAVKIQTYTADTMTIDCDNHYFQINQDTLWDGKTLYQLYGEAYTPWEWHPKLKKVAEELGLVFFSSPFDKTAVDFLDQMNVPAYKIASFEITDIPLIEYVASKQKPVIISTGISMISDIEEAINACKRMGNEQIALLKCTSAYPAPIEEINLRTISNMSDIFKTVVGISDHTLGSSVAIASIALGANIVEKHFILDRSLGGVDAAFSMEPEEFKFMVQSIREVEKALGTVNYELTEKAQKNRFFSRSLFAVENINAGEILNEQNIRSIRPGVGLHPRFINSIMGRRAKKNIKKGTPMDWFMIDE